MALAAARCVHSAPPHKSFAQGGGWWWGVGRVASAQGEGKGAGKGAGEGEGEARTEDEHAQDLSSEAGGHAVDARALPLKGALQQRPHRRLVELLVGGDGLAVVVGARRLRRGAVVQGHAVHPAPAAVTGAGETRASAHGRRRWEMQRDSSRAAETAAPSAQPEPAGRAGLRRSRGAREVTTGAPAARRRLPV